MARSVALVSEESAATLGLRPLTARSVLASALLGEDPPELPVSHLVALAGLFGVSPNGARVALSRMVGAGEAATDGDGRYRLAGHLLERRRRQEASLRAEGGPWDGTWHLVVVAAPASPPAHRSAPVPEELPADIADELATAAGPDWNHLRDRVSERMAAGIGAYQRQRFRDAARILRTVAEVVPNAPSVRELLGLSQYQQGHWKAALGNLEAFSTLTGSVDQHPVRMDCLRALGRPARVDALFEELRKGSPEPEVLAEGRLVLAGTRADRGDLDGAVRLLVEAGAGRLVRNPAERHLRQWYVLADLTERTGDLAKARELFARVAAADPDAYDVAARLDALGPAPKRTPRGTRGAR